MTGESGIRHTALARVGAAVLAVALLPAAWFATVMLLFGGLINAQEPDPAVNDGDPCCGYPDTWNEVGQGFVFTVIAGAVIGMLCFAIFATVR